MVRIVKLVVSQTNFYGMGNVCQITLPLLKDKKDYIIKKVEESVFKEIVKPKKILNMNADIMKIHNKIYKEQPTIAVVFKIVNKKISLLHSSSNLYDESDDANNNDDNNDSDDNKTKSNFIIDFENQDDDPL